MIDATMETIIRTAGDAENRYGPFTSTHEAYGVLAEEVSELLDAIQRNNRVDIGSEGVDVAAVAYRLVKQITEVDQAFFDRSNLRSGDGEN